MNTEEYNVAENLRKNGDFQAALPRFTSLWDSEPSREIGWRYAECLRKTGRLAECEKIAQDARKRYPEGGFATKQLAWCLQKMERYEEAIDLFVSLLPDDYVLSGLVTCLRKLGRFGEARKHAYEGLERKPADRHLKNQLGWVLYDERLKPAKEEGDLQAVVSAAEEILRLDPDDMLHGKTVLAVISTCKRQNSVNWKLVLNYSDQIKPDILGNEEQANAGRRRMSDREEFYIARARAFCETEQFKEARDVLERGILEFPNSFFLKRLDARAQAQMGNLESAAKIMRALQNHPQCAWYAQAELAAMEHRLGRTQEAYRLMCSALSRNRRNPEYLPTSIAALSEIALDLGKLEIAAANVQLAHMIRANRGWSISAKLEYLANRIQSELDQLGLSPVPLPTNEHDLLRQCQAYWREASEPKTTRKRGVVLAPRDPNLPHRFIQPQDGSARIYVRLRNLPNGFHDGMLVEFALKPSYDKKYNRESVEAVDVRPV